MSFGVPQDPTKERQITFLEAVKDEKGRIEFRYVLQQSLKNPDAYLMWKVIPEGAAFRPAFFAAAKKFQSDKARYLETGELPKED